MDRPKVDPAGVSVANQSANGGAGAQQRDRAAGGGARRAEREEREPILLPQSVFVSRVV